LSFDIKDACAIQQNKNAEASGVIYIFTLWFVGARAKQLEVEKKRMAEVLRQYMLRQRQAQEKTALAAKIAYERERRGK